MSATAIVKALLLSGATAEQILAAVEAYEKDHPPKKILNDKERYGIKIRKEGLSYCWEKTRNRIFLRDGPRCNYCGDTRGPYHIDHIIPLSRGGTNDEKNLCVSCATCNLDKGNLLLSEWMAVEWE